jgi:general secretion pathway protein I
MEISHQKLSTIKRGFSLIEIVVALVILSTSILVLYNLILSTSFSIYSLDDHYHSKEVANNRIALLNTIEKPSIGNTRSGYMKMGGKEWQWQETFEVGNSKELIKYEILIKEKDTNKYLYKSEGFLVNE